MERVRIMKKASQKRVRDVLAMARGTIVVDECCKELTKPLSDSNIHVVEPYAGEKDEDIIRRLLPNRIIVTKNPNDFKKYASSYDIGIIDLSKLKFIDADPSSIKNQTVHVISEAIIDFNLWSKRHGFILTLHENGKHLMKDLTV
jgi:hypothetical protein